MKPMKNIIGIIFICMQCGTTKGPSLPSQAQSSQILATAYTTRLPGISPDMQAIAITQAVYPATREENAAGAIILTYQDAALAFTAMHRITHMPINAPLLYLDDQGEIGTATKREMKRIKPDGVVQDRDVQVYIVGEVNENVVTTIKEELKYKIRQFRTNDPVQLAEILDRWQAAVKADHPDEVVLSALDHPLGMMHGIGAMGWNAHMGKGFAWVYRDSVPDATRIILDRRYGDAGAYLYITGSSDVVSDRVAIELGRYGLVRRIAGSDPFVTNAVNAGYKDFGRNFGWWWGWESRSFDWGLAESGHNYIFVSIDNILGAIPAALLGHMGKHGPILVVEKNAVPQRVVSYLQMVKPFPTAPMQTILNHGWIIGDTSIITWNVQKKIHSLLEPGDTDTVQQGEHNGFEKK